MIIIDIFVCLNFVCDIRNVLSCEFKFVFCDLFILIFSLL